MDPAEHASGKSIDWTDWVPIFPLPNAVLMPRHVLPLHVFEPRYRVMTRHALSGSRLIAVALLQPGYEPLYHTLEAPIHATVGVGRILREERLPDGRYNFLLQGVTRAQVLEEDREGEYRKAMLEPTHAQFVPPEVECAYRVSLKRLLTQPPLAELAAQANWLGLFECADLTFSDLLDVLAAAVLPCPEEKQKFLEEASVAKRAQRLTATIETYGEHLRAMRTNSPKSRTWPPDACSN